MLESDIIGEISTFKTESLEQFSIEIIVIFIFTFPNIFTGTLLLNITLLSLNLL